MFKLLQKLSKRQEYAALLLCILLSGCSQYNFVPPQSPGGLSCISNCAVLREECNSEESRCTSGCNIIEQKCMAANAGYQPYGGPAYAPHSPYTPPFGQPPHHGGRPQPQAPVQQNCEASKNHCEEQCETRSFTRNCSKEYRECYQGCGGTVIRVK